MRNVIQAAKKHPWRYIVQNHLATWPEMRTLQRRKATSGAMNRPEIVVDWHVQIADAMRGLGMAVEGSPFLEIGPGHTLGVAFSLLLGGGREIVAVDVKQFADPKVSAPFIPIADLYTERGLPRVADKSIKDIAAGIRYSIVTDQGGWPVESDSTDVVYSYFSSEHLRTPRDVMAESHRVLRDGGLCIHAIDLRNHDDGENGLKFLYYDNDYYQAMTSNRGSWCNRLRVPDWKALFQEFIDVVVFQPRLCPLPIGFVPSKVAAEFRHVDLVTLSADYLWCVGRKRTSVN